MPSHTRFSPASLLIQSAGAALAMTNIAGAQQFFDLSTGLDGSIATAVSADGTVVSVFFSTGTFRWTEDAGFEPPIYDFYPYALPDDGTTIVGAIFDSLSYLHHAARWVSGTIVPVDPEGAAPGDRMDDPEQVRGGSADGSIVAGFGTTELGLVGGFVSSSQGTVLLDMPAGYHGVALDVSASGQTIVGEIRDEGLGFYDWLVVTPWQYEGVSPIVESRAILWSSPSSYSLLDTVAGTDLIGRAHAVSADGTVVVGRMYDPGSFLVGAMRWTAGAKEEFLFPSGGSLSCALAANADGTVIVGFYSTGGINSHRAAFVWDAVHGVRDLQTALTASGVDLTDWTLTAALDVSDDGTMICGVGDRYNPDLGYSIPSAFAVRLDAPPTQCSADIDLNFRTDVFDFGLFASVFGTSIGDEDYNPAADFDGNGSVDVFDFGIFASDFGCPF